MQEMHSTIGTLTTWQWPRGYRVFTLHGTTASAGVVILVAESFLNQFDHDTNE